MKTFKVVRVTIPPDMAQIELSPKEFSRLAEKLDFTPVFQNKEARFYIDPETRIMYFSKRPEP